MQTPGYVLIYSEMIHNARIIPLDGRPHLNGKVDQWEGDPRGRWEGNALVIESTNFKAVDNLRAPNGRARQSPKRRIVERLTIVDANTLKLRHGRRSGNLHGALDDRLHGETTPTASSTTSATKPTTRCRIRSKARGHRKRTHKRSADSTLSIRTKRSETGRARARSRRAAACRKPWRRRAEIRGG